MPLSTDYKNDVILIRSSLKWRYRNLTDWTETDSIELNHITCEWSEWSEGECSQTCGGGRKTLQRTAEPPCLSTDIKMLDCNTQLCPGMVAFLASLALLLGLTIVIIVLRVSIGNGQKNLNFFSLITGQENSLF